MYVSQHFVQVLRLWTCRLRRCAIASRPITLHELHLLKFIHKCLHHTETLPAIFQDYFRSKKSVHLHFTRGSDDLYLPLCTRSIGQRMSVVKGSKCWNMLPVDLKQCSSFAMFLKRLKVYISDRALK